MFFVFAHHIFSPADFLSGVLNLFFNVWKITSRVGEEISITDWNKFINDFLAKVNAVFGFKLTQEMLQTILNLLIRFTFDFIFESFEQRVDFILR